MQSAVNNTIHKDTRRTPNEALMGYRPKVAGDVALPNEVEVDKGQLKLEHVREHISDRIKRAQTKAKRRFDAKRTVPNKYKIGDLVVIEKSV